MGGSQRGRQASARLTEALASARARRGPMSEMGPKAERLAASVRISTKDRWPRSGTAVALVPRRHTYSVGRRNHASKDSASRGEALVFLSHGVLAIHPFETANGEMAARYLPKMLDEGVVH